MRVDAARRRAAILREARSLFAENGGDVALESIADAAGVGIATLYRNFESRAALIDEVTLAILDDLAAATAAATAELSQDPHTVWQRYVAQLVRLDLGALTAAFSQDVAGGLSAPVRDAQETALSDVEALLVHARAAALVPRDVGALELVVAIGVITRPQPEPVRDAAPHLVDRLISLVLAGMHAEARRQPDGR